ncbi:peptide transporter mtd1 [Moniliophthora roreri MCA 2997]|uniref:Peptide transporter mtd1 n=2 Tax=Moniliophthora roreri TaxID=221103 RepID=V2XBX0_MONRO|nr:peptide transporter mtd1 [Moniliophthora roreri MCA 2997]KAI3604462.1 peptide transporter mtd1 [Moniliophthora roreri]
MATVPTLAHRGRTPSEKLDAKRDSSSIYGSLVDEKGAAQKCAIVDSTEDIGEVYADGPRLIDLGEDGKERPIETDQDCTLRLISLEDDPQMPIYTFRIFYSRPQTIYVSNLFLQVVPFILGKGLESIIPGPSPLARLKAADNKLRRFMNDSPFNIKKHVAMTIMSSTASHSAKAISIFTAQDLFYNVKHNAAIGIFTYASRAHPVHTIE